MKRWQKLALSGAGSSAIALAMTMDWEGHANHAYYDRYGKAWTICYGHTEGVKAGDVASDAQCDAWLEQDQADARDAVNRCIHVPLTEAQRAAFTDGAHNLGSSLVCGSTLQAKANSGNIIGACLELTDALDSRGNNVGWVHAGGKVIPGLRNRRVDERNACLGYFQ